MNEVLLSDIYWKLHRNSIISAFLLFLSANYLIKFSQIDGTIIDINGKLLSVFLLIWSSYAILVFTLEGGREETSKSAESRKLIKRRLEQAEQTFQSVNSSIRELNQAIGGISVHYSSALINLSMSKNPTAPSAIDLRETVLAQLSRDLVGSVSEFDQTYFEDRLNLSYETIYNHLSGVLQFSRDELQKAILSIDRFKEQTSNDLLRVESTLKREKFANSVLIARDSMRAFLTGRTPPITFYAFSLIHFLGIYFPVFPSSIDVLKSIHLI